MQCDFNTMNGGYILKDYENFCPWYFADDWWTKFLSVPKQMKNMSNIKLWEHP
jgi:hypothetical protein